MNAIPGARYQSVAFLRGHEYDRAVKFATTDRQGSTMQGRHGVAWWCLTVVAIALLPGCARFGPKAGPADYVPSIWPTPEAHGPISSSFGVRKDPFTGESRFHNGIDIAAPKKSPVVATACGRVTFAGKTRGGYGKLVRIDHQNGYQTCYAHLRRIKTRCGKFVKRGEKIGAVGATGRATGSHLQYEVRKNGKPVDPQPFLSK